MERQVHKELLRLRLVSFQCFQTEFAPESATSAKVVMLLNGFSEPKLYKVSAACGDMRLVPFRLFRKQGAEFVEVRFEGAWHRLLKFVNLLFLDYRLVHGLL